MKGERNNIFLFPFSLVYGLVVTMRNILFDLGIFRVHKFDVPVISVGNITAGGTGKTPFVEFLVGHFRELGVKVCVLSRGYGRSTSGTRVVSDGEKVFGDAALNGDEPQQVSEKYPGTVVVVDEKRVRGARYAMEKFRPQLIILDDGFQHRSIGRNLDVVMIDGGFSTGDTFMIPAGRRREPMRALGRAGLLVSTNAAGGRGSDADGLQKYSAAPSAKLTYKVRAVKPVFSGETISPDELSGAKCVAFCGIGSPSRFTLTLSGLKLNVLEFIAFPDHHRYSAMEIGGIERSFEKTGAKYLITTEKDALRLRHAWKGGGSARGSCFYLEVGLLFVSGERTVHEILTEKIAGLLP